MEENNSIRYHADLYLRISREDGDKAESESIINQRDFLLTFLVSHPEIKLHKIRIDDGYSGTNFNRPAFQRMIEDIEMGKVNCVIVKDLSRFGRDYIDTGKYLERYFPDNNVRFISITDNIDSIKQAYDMLLPIKNIFNEQYARDISKKVHASMKTKQKAGEFIGAFASYGYKKSPADKNKLIIDTYAAGVVQRIFNLYINGYGKNSIARLLNKEGIVCPSEYKKLNGENYKNSNRLEKTSYWTYSTINRLLQNEMYTGTMIQGRKVQYMKRKQCSVNKKEWIIVKDTHEAIIDSNTWEKAQDLLKRRTRTIDVNQNISIFAGFLKCKNCGRSLVKKTKTQSNEEKVTYYCCGTYVRSGKTYCTPHIISHRTLEEIILKDLKTIIQSIDDIKKLIEKVNTVPTTINQAVNQEKIKIQTELEKVRKLKKNIYEDYREELISKEEYIAYRTDYLEKEKLLLKQLEWMESGENIKKNFPIFENTWIKRLLSLKMIEQLDRNIVVEMINQIKISQDYQIKIIYNFSNELEQLFTSAYIEEIS